MSNKLTIPSTRLTSMFYAFNKKYFNNLLRPEEVGFGKRPSTNWLGQTVYLAPRQKYSYVIKINPLLRGTRYEHILLHEMIHGYLWQKYRRPSGHDVAFNQLARDISIKSGYTITAWCGPNLTPVKMIRYIKEQRAKKLIKKYMPKLKEIKVDIL